jgi:homoserine acetyltransferase
MASVIHVIPNDSQDWVVKEEGGRELGHYSTLHEAEVVAQAVARKRKGELVLHSLTGDERHRKMHRGWWRRLIGI